MAKKVIVNVERVKQPKQPKDVLTHFKFKKVAKGENIKLKLVKKSKNN